LPLSDSKPTNPYMISVNPVTSSRDMKTAPRTRVFPR